jgi:hypothetical protein
MSKAIYGDARPFMDLLLTGDVLQEQIDDFVSSWHEADPESDAASRSLHEYLGMSWDEYRLWGEHPESLRFIAAARKAARPLESVLLTASMLGVAARSRDQKEARDLLQWLIDRGRVSLPSV